MSRRTTVVKIVFTFFSLSVGVLNANRSTSLPHSGLAKGGSLTSSAEKMNTRSTNTNLEQFTKGDCKYVIDSLDDLPKVGSIRELK